MLACLSKNIPSPGGTIQMFMVKNTIFSLSNTENWMAPHFQKPVWRLNILQTVDPTALRLVCVFFPLLPTVWIPDSCSLK